MNNDIKNGVYIIINILNNHCYIGSSAGKGGFKERFRLHVAGLKQNKHENSHLQRAWNKYGEENFVFGILEECLPENCIKKEQFYLDTIQPDYNICRNARSPLGVKRSAETIEKMRKVDKSWMKGDKNWSRSPEGRLFLKNFVKTKEHRENLSKALTGKPKSKEHADKCKMWNKNNFMNDKNPNFKGFFKFKNRETGEEIICGTRELARRYNLDDSATSKMCRGKITSHHNWICLGKTDKPSETHLQ